MIQQEKTIRQEKRLLRKRGIGSRRGLTGVKDSTRKGGLNRRRRLPATNFLGERDLAERGRFTE